MRGFAALEQLCERRSTGKHGELCDLVRVQLYRLVTAGLCAKSKKAKPSTNVEVRGFHTNRNTSTLNITHISLLFHLPHKSTGHNHQPCGHKQQ
jgi:hypothetical protein